MATGKVARRTAVLDVAALDAMMKVALKEADRIRKEDSRRSR
jgi:hypothetical protein